MLISASVLSNIDIVINCTLSFFIHFFLHLHQRSIFPCVFSLHLRQRSIFSCVFSLHSRWRKAKNNVGVIIRWRKCKVLFCLMYICTSVIFFLAFFLNICASVIFFPTFFLYICASVIFFPTFFLNICASVIFFSLYFFLTFAL